MRKAVTSIWLLWLLSIFCEVLSLPAFAISTLSIPRIFDYDYRNQPQLAYEVSQQSSTGYDAIWSGITTGTLGSLVAKAKTTPAYDPTHFSFIRSVGAPRAPPLGKAGLVAAKTAPTIGEGTRVFRVWGDEAGAWGRSWTTVDPRTVPGYRNAAGLPNQNTGRFISEGILQNTEGVTTRGALPLHGNVGGLPEVVIPNPAQQIRLQNVQGLNPQF